MQQQETFEFPTPPLAQVEKMMPHDARIREVYLSGKGITLTARELGIGRRAVELAVHRMGIVRTEAQQKNEHIDWDKAVALYRAGYGTKHIAKACGASCHPSIREGLINRGVYQTDRQTDRGSETWAGYAHCELAVHSKLERQHDKWWGWMPKRTSREYALAAYYKHKHTPRFKMKQLARSQVIRIARASRQDVCSESSVKYLGCSYEQAAHHIEDQLKEEWSWYNHGKLWEIDHIIQLSDGDLEDEEHIKRVCHYTNLRPLSVRDNRTRPKGAYAGHRNDYCDI